MLSYYISRAYFCQIHLYWVQFTLPPNYLCGILIIFLWTYTQISEAFKRFGISENDNAVLIVLVHNKEEACNKDDILSKVDGQQIPVDQISSLSDLAKIKKVWFWCLGVTGIESDISFLSLSIKSWLCFCYFSFTNLHLKRKSVEVFWMLLSAEWLLRMLSSLLFIISDRISVMYLFLYKH